MTENMTLPKLFHFTNLHPLMFLLFSFLVVVQVFLMKEKETCITCDIRDAGTGEETAMDCCDSRWRSPSPLQPLGFRQQ